MKKTIKNLLASTVVLGVLAPSAAACNIEGSIDLYNTDLSNARVWAENTGAKILQNGDYDFSGGTLSVSMAKNESEGTQIEIYAKKDIQAFDVEISDLYSGNAKIDSEDISVFVEKYMEIENKSNRLTDFPYKGMVPDAILPIDTSIAYGENKIEKGNNQGIYLEVKTQADTPAGVYEGEATVYMDKTRCILPLKVTVWDFALPDSPSVKNYWNMANWREAIMSDSYDCSDEMKTKYFEQMLEYGVNSELPFSGIGGTEKYVELLRKYYNAPGFSSYRFYFEAELCVYENVLSYFDHKVFKDYVKAVAKASVEDKTNYLDKAMLYMLSIIDEPSNVEAFEKIERISYVYGEVLKDADEEMKAELKGEEGYSYYLETVSDTLLNIPNLLTLHNHIPDILLGTNDDHFTYCPQMHLCNTSEAMDFYIDHNDTWWWYTCTGPQNPYPSTHIDDHLVNARVIGWMTRDSGAEGYLNWGFALSSDYTTEQIENWSNGDGWISYPGEPYGIDGFVPTLRLVAFRDGMEDYEYLKLFEEKYEEMGLNGKSALQAYYDRLYQGTTVTASDAQMMSVRKELAETLVGLESTDYLYDSIEIHGGEASVKLYTPKSDAEIYADGQKVQGANGHYEIKIDLSKTQELVFTYKDGEKEYEVRRTLCGEYVLADDFSSKENLFVASFSSAEINEDPAFAKKGSSVKMTLQGKETDGENYSVYFHLDAKMFENGIPKNISSITLYVYNAQNEDITFNVFAYTGSSEIPMQTIKLKGGWNEVVLVNVNALDADFIQRIVFKTENYYDENGGKVFYIDEASYVKTSEVEK